jgi:hypothetical protein
MTIENQKQFEECQARLMTMEKSVAELRQTVLPPNPACYQMMSKQLVHEIEKARNQPDQYLGLNQPDEATLWQEYATSIDCLARRVGV